MFKISRLTDYGVVLLSHLAQSHGLKAAPSSARDLALASGLPLPTVSKLLKILAKHRVVAAHRGALGGYELLKDPKQLSVLTLIEAFEGKPAITTCMKENAMSCAIHGSCGQKGGWHLVHRKVAHQLSQISLFELMSAGSETGVLP